MAPRKAPRKSLFGSQKWYFPDFPFRGSIVGHSPGFICTGPRGASKNIGLGRT